MKSSKYERVVTTALLESLHALGRGTVSRVNKALGWPPRSMYKYIDRGLRIHELFAILSKARIDPAIFFGRIFGTASARKRFVLEARALLPRFEHLVPLLSCDNRNEGRLTGEQLDQIDDLLNLDPRTAIETVSRLASAAALDGRENDAAVLTLCKGSALRLLLEYDAAHACLGWALDRSTPARMPDGLRHAALLWGDYADYSGAIELASVSIVGSLHAGELTMAARGQLVRCRLLREAGRVEEAFREIRSAIELLDMTPEGNRYQGCAHRLLADLHLEQGDADAAADAVIEAAACGVPQGIPTAKLTLVEARIWRSRGESGKACEIYQEALKPLEVSVTDYPRVACELALYCLEQDNELDAREFCKSVTKILELTSNQAAIAALGKLVEAALSGQISEALLRKTMRKMRSGTFVRPAVTRPRVDARANAARVPSAL